MDLSCEFLVRKAMHVFREGRIRDSIVGQYLLFVLSREWNMQNTAQVAESTYTTVKYVYMYAYVCTYSCNRTVYVRREYIMRVRITLCIVFCAFCTF